MIRNLVIFLGIVGLSQAFFSFGKSKDVPRAPEDIAQDFGSESSLKETNDIFRGVHPSQMTKYSELTFTCDSGKVIDISSINDGFCDCEDGTDEPGTSACSFSFYCLNKGYRPLTIPSSRVDDGICDCCDGSDERGTACPNLCAQLADKERDMIQKLAGNYFAGSKIRLEREQATQLSLEEKAFKADSMKDDLDRASAIVDENREIRTAARKAVEVEEELTKKAVLSTTSSMLQLDKMSDGDLVKGLYALFNILRLNEDEVSSMLRSSSSLSSLSSSSVQDSSTDHNYEDSYGSDNSHFEEGYEGDQAIEEHFSDPNDGSLDSFDEPVSEPVVDSVAISSPESSEYIAPICNIVDSVNNDTRVALLCDGDHLIKGRDFLVSSLLRFRKPFDEVQVIWGYYFLYGTFDGAENFARSVLQGENPRDSCPSSFAAAPMGTCNLASVLKESYRLFDESFERLFPEHSVVMNFKQAEDQFYQSQSSMNGLRDQFDEASRARDDLDKFKGHLDVLSYRQDCFDTQGGHYTYTVCFLDEVRQREDSGSVVSLGQYSSLEEGKDGSITMKFVNGVYCYAHGPRSADVHIVCGAENKLLSAREPSTCFYAFEMESPIACTEQFAEINGLNV